MNYRRGGYQEDAYGTTYIGMVCTSLAIALAESGRIDGKELITTLVAAYEIFICERIGDQIESLQRNPN